MPDSQTSGGLLRRAFRPVADLLVSPAVFDFWVSRFNRLWSWQRPLARVIARHQPGPGAVTLVLRCNRHCPRPQPGQHINLTVEIDGRRLTRCYSPHSLEDGRMTISVKAVEDGRVSRHLCERVRVGDVLELGTAFGQMNTSKEPHGHWLMLAAGSGITPLYSLVQALAERGMPPRLDLVHWVQRRSDLWFEQELRELAAVHPGLHVHHVTTREQVTDDTIAHGRLDAALLQQLVGDVSGRPVMACGPAGFIQTAQALLEPVAASFQAEAFTPPVFAEAADGEVDVTLARRGLTLRLPRGQTLLAALEAAGIRPDSGCRMGICNSCACGKRSGLTHDVHTGQTESEPVPALRLCINRAGSDLVLDL